MQIAPLGTPLLQATDQDLFRGILARGRVTELAKVSTEAGRPLEVMTDPNPIAAYKHGR